MDTLNVCPNCGSKISKGVFNSNQLKTPATIALINEMREDRKEGYCDKCYTRESEHARTAYNAEIEKLKAEAFAIVDRIPIVSSHSPADWEYETIGVVTGQSVMGTGFFSELSSSVSDLLGTQSNSLNNKIRVGERNCFAQLRGEAINRGANAIVALDIDYNEMGGMKGMVMVCMTGTAVILKNKNGDLLSEYKKRFDRIAHLERVAKSVVANGQALPM